jgi:hypothetical protein
MFFDGPSIYSYGRHFEIARIVDTPKHGAVVLFNTDTYSVSTAKHQRYTRHAVSHYQLFEVPTMEDHARNVADYLKRFESKREEAIKSRTRGEYLMTAAARLVSEAALYCEVFKRENITAELRSSVRKLEKKRLAAGLFTPEEVAAVKSRIRAASEAQRKARQERERKEAERLEAWKRGEGDRWFGGMYSAVYLRVKDDRVETSRGAQITAKTAEFLWKGIARGMDVCGLRLDNYTVNSWDGKTLTVGCHRIPVEEMNRIAPELGLKPLEVRP